MRVSPSAARPGWSAIIETCCQEQRYAIPAGIKRNYRALLPNSAWSVCVYIASVRRDAEFGPLSGHSGLWQAARLADLWVHRLLVGRRDQAGQGGEIQRG